MVSQAMTVFDFSARVISFLSPLQISGVLRALNESNMVNQKSNPVVITEDNEKASISLIDRVPIITTTTNQGTSTSSVSEEVRYTIDASDSTDPETTREIGVTISSRRVCCQMAPSGCICVRECPDYRKYQRAASGNFYPRVSEATIQSIARIPDGHSLIVGGFYGEVESKDDNKSTDTR